MGNKFTCKDCKRNYKSITLAELCASCFKKKFEKFPEEKDYHKIEIKQ